jgi:DeoR family suf operon transcriptional repressor
MIAPVSSTAAGQLPSGFKGPRGAVLVELKRGQRLTARELAARMGISLNGVRHHLKELEGAGLVRYERVQRGGVGAPVFAWLLTPIGEALFPRRYKETLDQLLDHVVAREGRAAAVRMLEGYFDALAERLAPAVADLPPGERVGVVVRALSDEGYMAEGHATFCCGTVVEHNCPIRGVAERFPEICDAETRFLATVLGGTVERRAHQLGGCSSCEYKVRFPREGQETV